MHFCCWLFILLHLLCILFSAETGVKSLEPVRRQYQAESGGNGGSQNRTGKNGKPTVVKVKLCYFCRNFDASDNVNCRFHKFIHQSNSDGGS